MKLKTALITIIILFSGTCGLNAQTIQRARFLLLGFNTNSQFPSVYSDSVMISKVSHDTVWFNTSAGNPTGQGFYYKAGNKVYRTTGTKDFLLYDYGLQKGDSFIVDLFPAPFADTFIVDSVYLKALNHHTFRAWHLSTPRPHILRGDWDWIEGMGDLRRGWDTRLRIAMDGGWEVKGICLNDSVLYWDSTYNYFKDRNPSPTCSFDSVSKRLNIEKAVKMSDITLYPNPAFDRLTIHSGVEGVFNVFDYTGKICIAGIPFTSGSQTFDIEALPAGIYLMAIQTMDGIYYKRICVVRP